MERKYGQITVEGKDIPVDEPLFLLRGQDRLAAQAVMYYAHLMEVFGYPKDQVDAVRQWSERMHRWPVKKLPD